jgi:hypothetical protein
MVSASTATGGNVCPMAASARANVSSKKLAGSPVESRLSRGMPEPRPLAGQAVKTLADLAVGEAE